jgi:hypothetical protein
MAKSWLYMRFGIQLQVDVMCGTLAEVCTRVKASCYPHKVWRFSSLSVVHLIGYSRHIAHCRGKAVPVHFPHKVASPFKILTTMTYTKLMVAGEAAGCRA